MPSLFLLCFSFFFPRITGAEDWLKGKRAQVKQNPDKSNNILPVYPLRCCGIDIRDPKGVWVTVSTGRYMHCSAQVSLDLLHGRQPAMDRIAECGDLA